MKHLAMIVGLVWAAWMTGLGPVRAATTDRPNVLFILTDDQRPDSIGALGNEVIRTPNLDRLVREGTVFTRALTAYPICVHSRAEILSGSISKVDGRLRFGRPLATRRWLWPRTMHEAGYHTWYVGKWHNDGQPTSRGYEQTLGLFGSGGGKMAPLTYTEHGKPITGYRGWVFKSDDGRVFPEQGVGLTPDTSRYIADAAIEFLRRRHDRPFFLHVNFPAPTIRIPCPMKSTTMKASAAC